MPGEEFNIIEGLSEVPVIEKAAEEVGIVWKNVESTSIEAVKYNLTTGTLSVRFLHSGDEYDYMGVSEGIYQAFMASTSKGSFLNREIKGKFEYSRTGNRRSLP